MNYYNVEFWKNALSPMKRAPEKNKYEHADTAEQAIIQARATFGDLTTPQQHEADRTLYPVPWAARATPSGAPPAPPRVAGASGTPVAAGAAGSTAVADAPAAVAGDAASGPLVTPRGSGKRR